jgi:hypothetical protein
MLLTSVVVSQAPYFYLHRFIRYNSCIDERKSGC